MTQASNRLQRLQTWLAAQPEVKTVTLQSASADASFRRYFRVAGQDGESLIVMDAPPEHEDCGPFITVANWLQQAQVPAPVCGAFNADEGFLLLSDLGSETLLQVLKHSPSLAQTYYTESLSILARMQSKVTPLAQSLPAYDETLLRQEMHLFRDWLLAEHLQIQLSQEERKVLAKQFELLSQSALRQPKTFVHRDYHSRNIMVKDGALGVLDFQDAVIGPITYDAVSLLRDCYIDWPDDQVYAWLREYYQRIRSERQVDVEFEKFVRWFDWMGVQRHLKASGIFCRLLHRDGKDGYINDIPRTLNYIVAVAGRYRELKPLREIVLKYCAKPFGLNAHG